MLEPMHDERIARVNLVIAQEDIDILQELDPFESGAAELQLHHLEHNRRVMEAALDESA